MVPLLPAHLLLFQHCHLVDVTIVKQPVWMIVKVHAALLAIMNAREVVKVAVLLLVQESVLLDAAILAREWPVLPHALLV